MSKPENLNFCTSTNFKSAAVYLSQELQNLGFKYRIIEANGEKINLVSLVNNCWDLIQKYHSSIKENRNLHEERHKDLADLNYLQTAVKELRANNKDSEKHLLESQEKERQLNVVNKAFASKLKVEKDEIKRLSSVLQQKDIQHHHEAKKLELSNTKLKDRISRLISNDRNIIVPTMRMSSSLDKTQGSRNRWKTEQNSHTNEAELYQKVFSRYEAWINQLVDETEALKEFLADVGLKLANLSNKCAKTHLDFFIDDKDLLNGSITSSVFHPEATENAVFAGQFTSGREQIRKNFDDHLHIIERAVQFDGSSTRLPERLDTREMDVEAEFIAEGLCVEQKAQLLEEHGKLHEQRYLLGVEREKFAAAAIRLNREKAEFELEKVELLRQQFLTEFPPKSSCSDSINTDQDVKPATEAPFWHDFLDQSPSKHYVMPFIMSPKGNIRQTETATYLGPNTLRQPLRTNQRLSRTCVGTPTDGASAPGTRPPSLNRTMSSAKFDRNCRTLEMRGKKCNLTPTRVSEPLSFTYPRMSALDLSHADPPSLTPPPPAAAIRRESRAGTGSRRSASETLDDLYSLDSGFGQDGRDDADDVRVGQRLTVLEQSLVSLLNKIETNTKLRHSRDDSSPSSASEGEEVRARQRGSRLSAPTASRSAAVAPSAAPSSSVKRRVARARPSLPLKLISAPSSLAATRPQSKENR